MLFTPSSSSSPWSSLPPDSVCFPSAVPLFLFNASFASSSPSLASSSSNLASFDMRAYSSSSKTYLVGHFTMNATGSSALACERRLAMKFWPRPKYLIDTSCRAPARAEQSFESSLFAFWLRSSVVSVLFSLISETCLRTHSRLFLFLQLVRRPLSLLMSPGTVSLVLHCLQLTRTSFSSDCSAHAAGHWRRVIRKEETNLCTRPCVAVLWRSGDDQGIYQGAHRVNLPSNFQPSRQEDLSCGWSKLPLEGGVTVLPPLRVTPWPSSSPSTTVVMTDISLFERNSAKQTK
ncbi:hypothetical protein KC323_g24 [Hortaea werneckii]|nr:hypothetical protein KC323_g24 [Hortaea werneckii]